MRKLILAAGLGLMIAVSAAAAPARPAIHAGEVVTVHWGATPAGVEEMELLLSLDGGRHFTVRVTPDLDAGRGSYAWTVPPLPARDARLAVRMNIAGREILGPAGQPFTIAAGRTAAPPWAVRERGGDLWVTAPEDRADAGVAAGISSGVPRGLSARFEFQVASLVPPAIRLPPSRSASRPTADPAAQTVAAGHARNAACPPCLVLPLRI